ncbi:MAG: Rrf2 family transcriptional regulator [Oscillospiraceae bacterium]|nr:Rrf2 family transcriptional regulator [Oscillospiraceae bacterium]
MFSTKGRYALRVMVDLAEHADEGYIPLKDIAERQNISKKYLEVIMKELVNGKLVTGVSGKGGGYKLSKRPEEYSVGEILEYSEGPLASVACLANDAIQCPRAAVCETLPLWEEYDKMTHDFFYGKKLSDMIR